MEPLLYLVHRIPYPPNKGDKIRSYHLLKYLARHFDVYLGAFVDDPGDWRYEQDLKSLCAEVKLVGLEPGAAKIRSLTGIFTNKALSLPYYYDGSLQSWIGQVIPQHGIQRCVIFSSAMAQYLIGPSYQGLSRIADFVDVDSDKWQQYSASHRFPMNWLYRREARKLAKFEGQVTECFDAVLLVSEDELNVFKSGVGSRKAMLDFFNNGVDAGFFDPQLSFDNPFGRDKKVIVFTGAMDYWANVDAVRWFVEKVLPTVQNQQPETQFIIVGSNPTEEVTALGQHPGVRVTGRVEDIRPYLRHANLAVAPLRIARGVQNKVLEAMSMATPVVATPAAMEGIAHCETYRPVIAQAAHEFAQACIRLLDSSAEESRAPAARECIKRHYDWDTNLDRVGVHLGVASGRRHDGQEAVG